MHFSIIVLFPGNCGQNNIRVNYTKISSCLVTYMVNIAPALLPTLPSTSYYFIVLAYSYLMCHPVPSYLPLGTNKDFLVVSLLPTYFSTGKH